MWISLHSQETSTIAEQVRDKLFNESNEGLQIVLCGHSLGGGYAILCGLELLHMKENIDAIVAHGAPQVIIPNNSCELWRRLDEKTTVYVNGFDVVPRLPSCYEDWKETLEDCVAAIVRKKTMIFEIHINELLKKWKVWELFRQMGDFRHVGKLMFIQMVEDGTTECQLVDANGQGGKAGDGWDILRNPPEWSGGFIIENHSKSKYKDVLEAASKGREEDKNTP